MDHTRGSVDAFTQGSTAEILERSREAARADVEADLKAERKAHSETARKISQSQESISNFARSTGNLIASTLFVLVALILLLGSIFGPVGPLDDIVPAPIQAICAAVAVSLAVGSIIASFSLLKLRRELAASLARAIEDVLVRYLKL
jgi:hypothetical protein